MKILCLTSEFPPHMGGVASHVDEITRQMAYFGHDVTILTPDECSDSTEVAPPGRTICRRQWRSQKHFRNLRLAIWLHTQITRHRPDVLHVHDLKALMATKISGDTPVVFTNHTSSFLKRVRRSAWSRLRLRKWLSHVAALIAPSHERVEAAYEVGYVGHGYYVPNGVDIDKFSVNYKARQTLREKWKIHDDEPVILLASRLEKVKGGTDFAHACNALSGLRCKIVVAGDGSERQSMEGAFADSGISDQVLFLGGIPNPRMPEIYSAADLAVLPSHMEATSISGLEAMACGLSQVGTSVGGIPELIVDGETGFLVPPRNPTALGRAIRKLVEDQECRRSFGAQARKKAVAEFAWPKVTKQTLEILADAAAQRRSSAGICNT